MASFSHWQNISVSIPSVSQLSGTTDSFNLANDNWEALTCPLRLKTKHKSNELLSPADFHHFMLDGCCVVLFCFWWSPFHSWSSQDIDREILAASERDYHFLLPNKRLQITERQSRGKEWNTLRNHHDPIELHHVFHAPSNNRQNTVVVVWGSHRGREC